MNLNQIARGVAILHEAQPKAAEMKKAAQGFEQMFTKKLLETMRASVKHVSLGQSSGSEIYDDMINQTLSERLSKTGAFGISRLMEKTFSKSVIAQTERDIMLSDDPAKAWLQGRIQKTK